MKFLMFSDLHYHPGILHGIDEETLYKLQKRAEDAKCDFIIHAGDFCYGPSFVAQYVKKYNEFHIPSYHCLGNHDCDRTDYNETLKLYNMPSGYYYFDAKGYRIIVVDTNYFKSGEKFVHYNLKNQFEHPDSADRVPPEEMNWLRETILSSPYPCLIISHASFERECVIPKDHDDMIALSHEANASLDGQEIRDMVREINEKEPHKVLMLMNGHHHKDFLRIIENTIYWDVNATSYEWVCDEPHGIFPAEITEKSSLANHTVIFNEPLSAVVTLEGNTVTIEGAETTMFMGVTRELVGDFVLDRSGRPTRAKIQSAKITLGDL